MQISESLKSSFKLFKSLGLRFPPKYERTVISEVDDATAKLMKKFNIPKYNSYFSVLTTNSYPYLNVKELIFTNNGIAFLWLLDDFVDDTDDTTRTQEDKVRMCQEILDYLKDDKVVENKFIALLEGDEFWNGYKDEPVAARYRVKLIDMIEKGMIRKFEKDILPLEEYLEIRYYDCGVECCWVFMDFNKELPENQTTRLGNFIIWAVNDVYSYWKDVVRDGTTYNYLCCPQKLQAFDDIRKQLDARIDSSWTELSKDVVAGDELAIKVDTWCRANLIWHDESPRYSRGFSGKEDAYES